MLAFIANIIFWIRNAGMMGSGKTTVGKILSQVLSYLFFDRLVC